MNDGDLITYGDPTAYGDQGTPTWQYDVYSTPSQSPTTAAPAPTSWVGFSQIPQIAKDVAAVASAGFGLSLAKDQLQANRDIAKVGLQTAYWQAQAGAQSARYGAVQQSNAAALAQRYPNGVPFGSTRNDQIMILIGLVGLAFAYMQTVKK
jgi:hypothetical protein